MFVPEWEPFNLEDLNTWHDESKAAQWLASWVSLFTMAMLAPFYVSCGFMAYINRRIVLEGWDIEIRL